jgi:cobalt/nickel transport system permease protein
MLIGHLTIAGAVEAIVTGLVLAWLQRSNPQLLEASSGAKAQATATGLPRWVWGGLIALIVLTPIGLLAPGTAWGEWTRGELQNLGLGYIPGGFDRWSGLWTAPLNRYNLAGLNNPTAGYILSAALGVVFVLVAIFALSWLFERMSHRSSAADERVEEQ